MPHDVKYPTIYIFEEGDSVDCVTDEQATILTQRAKIITIIPMAVGYSTMVDCCLTKV